MCWWFLNIPIESCFLCLFKTNYAIIKVRTENSWGRNSWCFQGLWKFAISLYMVFDILDFRSQSISISSCGLRNRWSWVIYRNHSCLLFMGLREHWLIIIMVDNTDHLVYGSSHWLVMTRILFQMVIIGLNWSLVNTGWHQVVFPFSSSQVRKWMVAAVLV